MTNHESMKEVFERYLKNEATPEEVESVLNWLETEEGQAYFEEWTSREMEKRPSGSGVRPEFKEEVFGLIATNTIEPYEAQKRKRANFRKRAFYYSAAASILAIITLVWVYTSGKRQADVMTVVNTGAKRKLITLPDHSEVILYENSSLSYGNNWNNSRPRNVYLQGEGFFHVSHQNDNASFTVHTGDSVDVQVLGTSFEVCSQLEKTSVILKEGKVNIAVTKKGLEQQKTMVPGDMLVVRPEEKRIDHKKVDALLYTGRQKEYFELDHTSFEQMVLLLKDVYGCEVVVPSMDIMEKQAFSGRIPNHNLQEIVEGMSKLTGLNYQLEQHKVIFSE